MQRRCVICNEHLSEEEIKGAVDYAVWVDEELRRPGNEVYDEGGRLIPPEGANWNVIYNERAGWVHRECDEALGTGETPEERQRQFVEGMMNLLHGPHHEDSDQP